MRTANPAFGQNVFTAPTYAEANTSAMTVNGAAIKALLLLMLVIAPAIVTWTMVMAQARQAGTLATVGGIGGFIFALVTCFKKDWAPATAPIYCLLEGLFLGAISALFELAYPGIAVQAMLLTFGVFLTMLLLYVAGVLRATPAFTRGVVAATGAIFLVYLADIILGLFGVSVPFIHSSGPIGIGISLVIVAIAAFNLVLDFNLIEQGAAAGFPKYMEWYSAFGLMVTLIWLYIEILRLLAKMRQR